MIPDVDAARKVVEFTRAMCCHDMSETEDSGPCEDCLAQAIAAHTRAVVEEKEAEWRTVLESSQAGHAAMITDLRAELERLRDGREIVEELAKARTKHKPMNGPHEGYAVILEELDELWAEVKAQNQDPTKMRKEALQIGAMALRFIQDICDAALAPEASLGRGEPA